MAQAIILNAVAIALKPVRADLRNEPVRSKARQIIQGCAQGFPHTFQVRERAHTSQYMRRIGALFATRFEPSLLLARLQEPIQQEILPLLVHQTRTQGGEQGEVKAGIRQV